ncbi:hypothetical protein [Thalassobellus suaedae]|uniref:Auto-transporter adhesin head GIN domain-containing protein n=1 Tax=Thalassobellus suaedae TaxID=3074124 RepID=A0ABY9XPF5_9FLAO|nr:hypothetical protein RHP51_10195 [Flavobacteriaceae bacterium HL-DH14]
MKTNFYILLILLLSFSFANAQSTSEVVKVETNDTVTVSNNDSQVIVTVENSTVEVSENEVLLIDASQLKRSIARSSSDIRIYLNRVRNVDNIKLVFPKINKAIKA